MSTLKPYPKYTDSGVPWLGKVPKHWAIRRLKADARNSNEQTAKREMDEIYVALEHVVSWTGQLKLADSKVKFDGQVKRFRAGDVLFGKLRPYLAKVTRPASDGVCVGEFLVLRPSSGNLAAPYLERLLRAKPTIEAIASSTFGARMPRADWSFIGGMRISIPPLPEQTAIVRYLDHFDGRIQRAIVAKQKLIKLLEEQKQIIIHRAVTGQIDVSTSKPYPAYKDSGVPWLGKVPEHWGLPRLGTLLKERGETNDSNSVADVLSVTRTRGVIPYAEKGNIGNKRSEVITRYKIVRPNDIVVNCMNVIIGSVGLSKYTGCLSPVYYVLTRRSEGDNPHYLNAYFQAQTFQRSLVRIGNGILAHRMRIPMELLKCEIFPRPSLDEQTAIVRYLESATTEIQKASSFAKREIALLREYRTRLISDVVTGKIDVREAAADLPHTDTSDELSQAA